MQSELRIQNAFTYLFKNEWCCKWSLIFLYFQKLCIFSFSYRRWKHWTVLVVKWCNLICTNTPILSRHLKRVFFIWPRRSSSITKHLKQSRIVLLMQTDTLMWRKEIFIWFFVDIVVFYCKYLLYFIICTPPDALQPQQSIREVSDVLIIFPLFIVTFWDNFTYLWHSDSCHILCVYPPLRLEFLFQIWKLNKCYINLSLTQKETCWDIFYYSS